MVAGTGLSLCVCGMFAFHPVVPSSNTGPDVISPLTPNCVSQLNFAIIVLCVNSPVLSVGKREQCTLSYSHITRNSLQSCAVIEINSGAHKFRVQDATYEQESRASVHKGVTYTLASLLLYHLMPCLCESREELKLVQPQELNN